MTERAAAADASSDPREKASLKIPVILAALLLASCARGGSAPEIAVQDGWARATAPGQTSSAAYFTLANTGGADRLLSVSSPVGDASLHSTSMDNGIMRMRPLDALDVPANSSVRLQPGGTHVMLMRLKSPMAPGSNIRVDLRFERSGHRQVELPVRDSAGEVQ